MSRQITTVGVIGLGTMGAGIVEVFAKAGLTVIAVDGTPELAERGKGFLTASTGRQVERGRLDAAEESLLHDRVTWTHRLSDLAPVDLVIEAVPERLEIKLDIFAKLDDIVAPDAVLASNTSSLSLTEIASGTRHPERVIGMHFFNPAPVLKLVEVITTLLTDEALVTTVRDLAVRLGKNPVVVGDRAGFIANALLITYLARAIRMYESGHVSREDIDSAGRVGMGMPMGPLTLSDLIGLDVVKEVCDVLYAATKDPSAAPPALLNQLVTAGRLGRKTGRGLYEYDKPGSGKVTDEPGESPAAAYSTIAVVGTGAHVDEFAQRLGSEAVSVSRAGHDVSVAEIADPQAVVFFTVSGPDCEDCSGGDHLLIEGGADAECACCDGELEEQRFSAIAAALDPSVLIVAGDDEAQWALGRSGDTVQLRLHEDTSAGQIAEIGRALCSRDDDIARLRATLSAGGWTPIVGRARPGIVVDALLFPHLNDAVRMLDSGYASVADIDTAMVDGCGYPKGPFAFIDDIGADAIAANLSDQANSDDGVAGPNALLLHHVSAELPFGS